MNIEFNKIYEIVFEVFVFVSKTAFNKRKITTRQIELPINQITSVIRRQSEKKTNIQFKRKIEILYSSMQNDIIFNFPIIHWHLISKLHNRYKIIMKIIICFSHIYLVCNSNSSGIRCCIYELPSPMMNDSK